MCTWLLTLDLTRIGQNIQSMHRDHVPEVPASCELLGSSKICYNQGFVRYGPTTGERSLRDIQIFTVQGHPEFTRRIVDTVVDARAATGVFDQALVGDARSRADWRNDGVDVIGKVIWRIIGVDDKA